ncbi:P-loop containing nucleoside triphosphate hydrolase protein [Ganoderma leucocontextum]|nr:P-loop containing nucleoside triphosphate hydrolase protein [Ganoderma leucocontextum]
MDPIADELSAYLLDRLKHILPDARLIVGIAGVPASGKSTLAQLITDRVNAAVRVWLRNGTDAVTAAVHNAEPVAVYVGLDGWHLTRAQLDAFPDPKLAHDRRGAHWTFDGEGYVGFVRALRRPIHATPATPGANASPANQTVYAPSFDHAKKDPVFDSIPVYPHHRLVILEGLYTFLKTEPWSAASELLDERWWVDINEETAEKRLVVRHVKTGVAKDMEEAIWRSRENDVPNGRFIRGNTMEPTRVIRSIEDPIYSTDE